MVYGTEIHFERCGKFVSEKSFSVQEKITSIILASFLFLIEEVQNVFLFYKDCEVIQSLRKKYDRFENLSIDEKNKVQDFYNAKIRQVDRAQKLICRESSIQVVLQLTLIVYQANFQEIIQ